MSRILKREMIVEGLRRQIVQGVYPPGARIPPRTSIEKEFRASTVTVQRALDRLISEGFLIARSQHGTFVVENPPHLHHYVLLLSHPPVASSPRFDVTLNQEAAKLGKHGADTLSIFHGVAQAAQLDRYRELLELIRTKRLAGMIFGFPPGLVADTPLLTEPGIPRVAILTRHYDCGLPTVCVDYAAFFIRALDYLHARGRRRIGFIFMPHVLEYMRQNIHAALAERQMLTRPYWWQFVSFEASAYARECVHLLMHARQVERPDGLIIGDDNLLPHAANGLADAGVRVPDDVEVVAHANFPDPTPGTMPLKRLGFDCTELLRLCIESLRAQRRGNTSPFVPLMPVFDNEVAERSTMPSAGREARNAAIRTAEPDSR